MYQRLGRYDEAVRVFEQSIQRNPIRAGLLEPRHVSLFSRPIRRMPLAPSRKQYDLTPVRCRGLAQSRRCIPLDSGTAGESAPGIRPCRGPVRRRHSHQSATTPARIGHVPVRSRSSAGIERRVRPSFARSRSSRSTHRTYMRPRSSRISPARTMKHVARLEQAIRLGYNAGDMLTRSRICEPEEKR